METEKIKKLYTDIQDLLAQSSWRAIHPTEVLDLIVRYAELYTFVASLDQGHPDHRLGSLVLAYKNKIWDVLIKSMEEYFSASGLTVDMLMEPSKHRDSMMGFRLKHIQHGHRELNVTFRFGMESQPTDFKVEVIERDESEKVTQLGSSFPELRAFQGNPSQPLLFFVTHLESVADNFLRFGVMPDGYSWF